MPSPTQGHGPDSFELHPPSHDYLQVHDPFSPTLSTSSLRPSMEEKIPLGAQTPLGVSATTTPHSSTLMNQYDSENDLVGHTHNAGYIEPGSHSVPRKQRRRKWWWIGGLLALLVIVGAVLGGVLGTQLNKKNSGTSKSGNSNGDNSGESNGNDSGNSSNGDNGSSNNGNTNGNNNGGNKPTTPSGKAESGTDGSTVTTNTGATFTYVNKFGGSWAVDPANPYNASGQAQSYTPKLTEEWVWGTNTIRGVNLGGWLVTEPFIVPALYEEYQNATPPATDEYSLSQAMGADLPTKMEEHYKTFITEQDFADIAGAGLNWVRIPLGYWAVETQEGEPYLKGVSWNYFVKAIGWARKYGLRILLDFHALPGSQNGWNHSGRGGSINWMYGPMGIANAQRSLEHIRSMVEYISQPGIKEVVPMLGLVNEVPITDGLTPNLGQGPAGSFYYQAYDMVRKITGFGKGNGPILAFHDGFLDIASWAGFLSGADRLALDEHLYLAFGDGNQAANGAARRAATACGWGGGTNNTQRDFGIVIGGEWSIAMGDCGKWLNGVGNGNSYNEANAATGGCKPLDEWMNWDSTFKAGLMDYALAQMDALQNWFFWTWRIGNSTELGYPSSPMWHYQLGLKEGWIPQDPRAAGGWCKRNNYCQGCYEFDAKYPASATGGVANPTIAASELQTYGAWPPTTLQPSYAAAQVSLLPTLTQTGTPVTLAGPSPTISGQGSGWANPSDNVGAYVQVKGCKYAGVYDGAQLALPTAVCTGA